MKIIPDTERLARLSGLANEVRARNEGELADVLERVMLDQEHGARPLLPPLDVKARMEFYRETMDKRDFGPFAKVFEFHGCVWWPPEEALARAIGPGDPIVEGKWQHPTLPIGFTPGDTFNLFASPEALDQWIREIKLEREMKRRAPGKYLAKVDLRAAMKWLRKTLRR